MAVENDIVEIIISEESWHSGQTELELHWKYKNYEAKLNEWEFFFVSTNGTCTRADNAVAFTYYGQVIFIFSNY